jgi:hypothetical protein
MQVPKLSFNWLRRISFHCLSSASNFHKHQTAYRKSNKKNTRRKKTQFKKGHKCTSTVKEPYTNNSSSASVSVLQRPTSTEFADALSAQSTSKYKTTVSTKYFNCYAQTQLLHHFYTWAGTLTFVWQKCRNHLRQFV